MAKLAILAIAATLAQPLQAQPTTFNCLTREVWSPAKTLWCRQLLDTAWLLDSPDGAGAPTLQFAKNNQIMGSGGCNQFTGTLKIQDVKSNTTLPITTGAIAATLRSCIPDISDREAKYFAALRQAKQLRLDGAFLLIDVAGRDQPLRFTKLNDSNRLGFDLSLLFRRIWQANDRDRRIYAFMPNGTVLETNCQNTYAIATWVIDKSNPRMLKISQNQKHRFSLTIEQLTDTDLQMQLRSGETSRPTSLRLKAVNQEANCLS